MGFISDHLHPVLREDYGSIRARLDLSLFKKRRWLITGATGFVPAYLVNFLSWLEEAEDLGLELALWVRSVDKARSLFPWSGDPGSFITLDSPDWQNPDQWEIPDCDYIIHAASPATPAACQADPKGVVNCNVSATRSLLRHASPDRLKGFLFFSSSEVYGDASPETHPPETMLGRLDSESPRSIYPLAKREGEIICREAYRQKSLPVKIARVFHTYGPGMDLHHDGRVFADFVGNAVRGEDIVVKSDGLASRSFCYLGDTLEALLTVLFEGVAGECYNVGNPDGVLSIRRLAELISGLAPGSGLKQKQPRKTPLESASGAVYPNISRLAELGWHPRVSPENGFSRTIKYYKQ
jgi:nucleoside-diphosphate-sugar epimerase